MSQKKSFFDFTLLKRIMRYAKPYKKQFILSCIIGILITAVAPLRPILIQKTLDNFIPSTAPSSLLTDNLKRGLIYIVLIQIGILLFETILKFVFSFFTALLGQNVIKDIRKQVFQKIIHFNIRQFDKTPIGTLTTRTINDIETINDIFANGFVPILVDLTSIIVILIAMFLNDWKLTLFCLSPFPLLLLATYYFKESVNKSFQGVRNAVAKLNSFVQEHISGIAIIKSFAAEERESKKFARINQTHKKANIKAIFAYSVFFPTVEIISIISITLIVGTAINFPIAPSTIAFYFMTLNMIFRPLRFIADKFNTLQMGMIAADRVFKVLDNPDTTQDNKSVYTHEMQGNIEFKNVNFHYVKDVPVLKNISFKIDKGQTLAIVGQTGSGKTSIISLINRMYEIEKGELIIDGQNIQNFPLEFLRKNIGSVSQDLFLFSDTIFNNITLFNPEVSLEKVIECAQIIDIHDFILELPNQYNYQVQERGATLSYGQRQLICFLRALLYDPKILLLDEATSSIDSQSEKLVQKAIDKLIKNRTSIIIAHRLSTIRKADMILVLDNGEIIEQGNHQTLYNKKGHYYELCNNNVEILQEV